VLFDQPNAYHLNNAHTWVFLKKDLDFFKNMVAQWNISIYDIIKRPFVTTKSIDLYKKLNQYTFEVHADANKNYGW
jgi:hypothetical protein